MARTKTPASNSNPLSENVVVPVTESKKSKKRKIILNQKQEIK